MTNFADRIVAGLRVQEQARPYSLTRAPITTEGGAANWLWDYRAESGDRIWFGAGTREFAGRHLLWLRFLYQERWIERGGRP